MIYHSIRSVEPKAIKLGVVPRYYIWGKEMNKSLISHLSLILRLDSARIGQAGEKANRSNEI